MNPICLIPAKGFSERLPKKNLRLLGGRPLVAWTIEAARGSGIFPNAIWVSSESDEVLEVATAQGVRTLRRPPELAMPGATVSDVVIHARRALEHSGPVSIMTPSSPFRSSLGIATAWEKFKLSNAVCLLSLRPYEHPPEWAFRFNRITGDVSSIIAELIDAPRAALPQAWRHDGSHFIIGKKTNHQGAILGFEADPLEAVDINTIEDLEYAEYLLDKGKVPWALAKN